MFIQSPAMNARSIIATSRDVGAKLPAVVLESYERANRIAKAAESVYPPRDAVLLAVIAALDESRDPAADAAVQRALVAQQIGASEGVGRGVADIVSGQMRETFRDYADDIVEAWAKPFDRAAKTLSTCHQRIGDVSLDDTATIMRAGGDIASVWAEAIGAARVIDSLDGAWIALATMTGFAPIDPRRGVLRIAAVTAEDWTRDLDRPTVKAWDVQLAGLALGLADSAEYVRRHTALSQGLDAIAADIVPIDTLRSMVAGREIRVGA